MFLPRQQQFDSAELDTVTGPLSVSTTARAAQSTAQHRSWPTGSTEEWSAVSASDLPASGSHGSAQSRGTRSRGAHRRVATKQGRSRLVVAGTASLAGISAILTGLALSGGTDTPAGDTATTGSAPSMGIGAGVSFTEPVTTQGSSDTGQPPARLVPPGTRSRSALSGRTATGSDPAAAPNDAGGPQVGIPASGSGTGTGIPAGAPALPAQPDATAPSTDGASNGPAGTEQVTATGNDPAAPAPSPATSAALSANPPTSTSPPTAVPPTVAPLPGTPPTGAVAQTGGGAAGTAPAPAPTSGTGVPAGGQASSGPAIAVPVPTTSSIPLGDLVNSVVELRDIAPVWPHSR